MRGPAFFAYADNYLIDVKFGVIVDVEASRAIRQAVVGAAKTMIERTKARFDLKPTYLAADTAYGSAETLNWIVNDKKIAPHVPVSTSQPVRMGLCRERTSHWTRNTTSTSAQMASCCTPPEQSSKVLRFVIVPPSSTAMAVRSKCNVALTLLHDKFLVTSTRMHAMLPGHWPKLSLSSSHVAIANE
jgi:hypothetical protein